MPDMARVARHERERRADGVYEITIGVVGERKLSSNTAAVELIHETLRTRRDEFFTSRGTYDGEVLLQEIAIAVADRLAAERLLQAD